MRFSRLQPHVFLVCHGVGRTVRPLGADLQECKLWLCRRTALHLASQNGHTETALALVEAGADVHCKANHGCGCSGGILVSVVLPQYGGGRSVHSGWSGKSGCLAVQADGAALGVAERPHGDGDGAGGGGRGRALPGQ